jgi:hypothetical protein
VSRVEMAGVALIIFAVGYLLTHLVVALLRGTL